MPETFIKREFCDSTSPRECFPAKQDSEQNTLDHPVQGEVIDEDVAITEQFLHFYGICWRTDENDPGPTYMDLLCEAYPNRKDLDPHRRKIIKEPLREEFKGRFSKDTQTDQKEMKEEIPDR